MHHKKKLIEYIKECMHPAYQKASIDAIQPAVKINYQLNKLPGIGCSKLGGYPDLPPNLNWPVDKKGIPYLFLAQINLREIQVYDLTYPIPKNTILYFFAELSAPYAFEVLFSKDREEELMHPRPVPKIEEKKSFWSFLFRQPNYFKVYPTSAISFEQTYTIPYYGTLYYDKLELEKKLEKVKEVITNEQIYFGTLFDEKAIQHHLFGDYQVVQNERIEGQLEGYNLDFRTLKKEDLPAIEASMSWILLLQLDSDSAMEFYFGDAGKTYFFIKKQDLLKGDFSKVKGGWDTH